MTEVVVFVSDDIAPVLAALRPDGWVNLQPEVDTEPEAGSRPSGIFAVFGARGPAVPFCTWHPGERAVGIEHSSGPKLARRIEFPAGWRVMQDHPKRGLVLRVTDDVTDTDAITWLLRTAAPLCELPLLGRWVAEVHP
jgi:hypothetical protein